VLASSSGDSRFDLARNQGARVDGFTVTGADTGGGVIINGYGNYVDISNNRVANNSGTFGGGIRVGHPLLLNAAQDGYQDGNNDFVRIHHNQVNQNGALDGAGAGISMGTGSDSYQVTDNWVCGNFNTGDGGGIGHIGRSDRAANNASIPLIQGNRVLFNETFNQGTNPSGGGIFIGGAPPLAAGTLSPGSGNVQVMRNLIQGNGNGAGDGGGIRLASVNGQDVADNNNSNAWYGVDLFNNMIVNNVAGLAGGGVSLQDAVKVRILHNTIANNDSLGTAGLAFTAGPNQSEPLPGAGIVARAHSAGLAGIIGAGFSDPDLRNTIVWHNRQFFFRVESGTPGGTAAPGVWGLCPDIGGTIAGLVCPGGNAVVYDDLGVLGAVGSLTCDPTNANCITSTTGTDPAFVRPYVNGDRNPAVTQAEITTAIQGNPAFDEGGNFIRPNYGPLTLIAQPVPQLLWDYHITEATAPQGVNLSATVSTDYDGQTRPNTPDVGADEWPQP
jgi:hypothetical protein